MEDGASHKVGPIPFCMIGSAGGSFRTGRVIRFPDPTPHNKLLASIVTGMGFPVTSYGAAGKERHAARADGLTRVPPSTPRFPSSGGGSSNRLTVTR